VRQMVPPEIILILLWGVVSAGLLVFKIYSIGRTVFKILNNFKFYLYSIVTTILFSLVLSIAAVIAVAIFQKQAGIYIVLTLLLFYWILMYLISLIFKPNRPLDMAMRYALPLVAALGWSLEKVQNDV
jgi:O-antigen/teichoic acid export membrane protein